MKNELKKEEVAKYNLRETPNGFKMKLVDELVSSYSSDAQIAIKFGLPKGTLSTYKIQLLDQLGYFRILNRMKQKKKQDDNPVELEQENAELKKALELAMLKVAGLETLVDVAEEQFNIHIRKKAGAKQSK